MNKHALWMLIGCALPLLLIFILPMFGVSNGVTIFIFIVLMFACHLMMAGHHDKHKHGKESEHESH